MGEIETPSWLVRGRDALCKILREEFKLHKHEKIVLEDNYPDIDGRSGYELRVLRVRSILDCGTSYNTRLPIRPDNPMDFLLVCAARQVVLEAVGDAYAFNRAVTILERAIHSTVVSRHPSHEREPSLSAKLDGDLKTYQLSSRVQMRPSRNKTDTWVRLRREFMSVLLDNTARFKEVDDGEMETS